MSNGEQGFKPYRSFFVIISFIIFAFSVFVQAAPHQGNLFQLRQPDGTHVTVSVWGDEYYQRVESIDGYSLIRNDYGWICYADVSKDGNEFVATDIVYEGTELNQMPAIKQYLQENRGLKKGLKINPASQKQKAQKSRKQLNQSKTDLILTAPGLAGEIEAAEAMTAAAPLLGSVVGLTILIDFPDEPGTISNAEVNNYCNQVGYTGYSNNGSVHDYFYDVSNGLLEYTNIVVGYYRALHDKTYYNDTSRSYGEASRELLGEALNWLDDQGFDFTQLSITSYNAILATNLFYAGNPDVGWAEGLWPHASGYFGFTTSSGITSGSYQISNLGSSLRLGTFCHENGHMICNFPDLYDYGYESNGIGNYGLMAGGGSSLNPVPPNPYLRDLKGWETIIGINNDPAGTILDHQANGFTTYRYSHPTNTKEFFLVESRLKTGRNASVPDEGLLIWHIDEAGSNDREQMTPEQHYKVSVEQADGLFGLEGGTNSGGSGDLFHAGYNDTFRDNTLPNAKWWDGSSSGLDISGISEVSANMSFILYAQESYPPFASDDDITLTGPDGAVITLTATDDGLPVPPGKLSYIITSLPQHGWLFDPNDSSQIAAVPYTLQNDANSVIYEPCPYYFTGTDGFSFKANDGGDAPGGGDSNIADVNIVTNMLTDVLYQVHTIYKDYIPFLTAYKKVRTQALYHADELGGTPMTIASLALNMQQAPGIEIQNLTIRMKHTALTEYPSIGAAFDNDGWTVVYDANETIADTGWHEFVLDTPFAYNGTGSLLVDFAFDNTATSSAYGYAYESATPEYRTIAAWANSGDPLTFQTPNFKWKRLFNLTLKTQPDTEILFGDFNYDCQVGSDDLMTLIDAWLSNEGSPAYNSACDISTTPDKKVDMADYAVLAGEWLDVIY